MEKENLCRFFQSNDESAVEKLVESIFGAFLEGKYWNWKYKENPYFDPKLVAVAEENGELLGCNHWLLRDLKVSSSTVDKVALAADVAVKPEHRGRGLGSDLLRFLRSSDAVKNRNLALIYMFTSPDLAGKFHKPAVGYVTAPDGTAQYTKVLSWKKVKENVDSLNEAIKSGKLKRKLPQNGLKLLFKMSAAPPLYIHVKEDGLVVGEGKNLEKEADVVVSGDLPVFNRIKMGKRKRWNFLKVILTRKLKVKVKLTRLKSLFGVLWVFEEVFSMKMT